MAPPAGQIRPGRHLAFFVAVVAVLYALVIFTGDGQLKPKLGIDLQGGTRVSLTGRTASGEPSPEQLNLARTIIETRVNKTGVSGAEVVLDGNNIVITVPGTDGEKAKDLAQTAQLRFRPVILQVGAEPPPPATSTPNQPPTSGTAPPATGATPPASGTVVPPAATGAPQGRPAPALAQEQPPAGQPAPGDPAKQPPAAPPGPCEKYASLLAAKDTPVPQLITGARECRQAKGLVPTKNETGAEVPADQALQAAALGAVQCSDSVKDPLTGSDEPSQPLVTCDQDGTSKYILGPSFLEGTEISSASSGPDPQGVGYVVTVSFKETGSKVWSDYTSANIGKQAAFVLDSAVVSAPEIKGAINGDTTITGGTGGFKATEATRLAETLKYGSLPLSFDQSEAETVSATLGLASLQAGLIAGGIGLLLVFVYCLFYYRLLGILTILSLVLSGGIVYAVLILLGRWIGFTLDLAGIAGFIVAIGITADSFVIFFERLKDEIRDGRTFRSAVPKAWVRARRTILSADAVQFLAAAVLYVLAVGQVKGFAFTLGMSTVLDLIVVFLVTHPLVLLASRSKTLSSPTLSGLGGVQKIAAQRRAAAKPLASTVKEV